MNESQYWYKSAIFYELYVRAFKDSNGDGWGDLKGVTEKLDYLQDLVLTPSISTQSSSPPPTTVMTPPIT